MRWRQKVCEESEGERTSQNRTEQWHKKCVELTETELFDCYNCAEVVVFPLFGFCLGQIIFLLLLRARGLQFMHRWR